MIDFMINTYRLSDKACEMIRSSDKITSQDAKNLMQQSSSCKVKMPKIGMLRFQNPFFSDIAKTNLRILERLPVFYALEKVRIGLYRKAFRRIFIYFPLSGEVFDVPPQAVMFSEPSKHERISCFISQSGQEEPICSQMYAQKKHICFFERMEVWREYAVYKKEFVCTADILKQHFRWSDPDPWVREQFSITDRKDPMFFLRNEPTRIPGWSVRLSYPSPPHLWGYHIDE